MLGEITAMPVLIFIPGLMLTPRLYDAQVAAFRGTFPVAFGATLGMDSITAMAEAALAKAEDMAQSTGSGREEGVPGRGGDVAGTGENAAGKKIIPVGLSMGGYVALEMARLAPQKMAGLIIMDSNATTDSPARKAERERLIKMSAVGRFRGVTKTLLAQFIAEANLNDETITRPIMAMAEEVGRDNFLLQQQAIMGRRDQRETLKMLDCPGLFIVGSEDTAFIEPVRDMAGLMKNSRYVEIDGAGHLPPLESPDAVTEAMAGFLGVYEGA